MFFFRFFGWVDHETKHIEDISKKCYCCAFIYIYIVYMCLYGSGLTIDTEVKRSKYGT